jgi:hypothetical protein
MTLVVGSLIHSACAATYVIDDVVDESDSETLAECEGVVDSEFVVDGDGLRSAT